MSALVTFWKFTRPHTLIGSVISICTLYTIICAQQGTQHFLLLTMALLVGISCNIFIVGINQVADVQIDRINKPYLPIPSGALTVRQAKIIVYTALGISLGLALYVTPYLFCIIALAAAIGWAYSMPPLHLKQHHLLSALAISTVRGVLINVGGFLVFNYMVNHSLGMPLHVKILTLFIVAFSIVISWFKDLPDVEGDAQYRIRTLALVYSPKAALIAGNVLVGIAYAVTLFILHDEYADGNESFKTGALFGGHLVLFALFILNGCSIRLDEHRSVKKFYKRFWWFFFAEYMLYLVVYLI